MRTMIAALFVAVFGSVGAALAQTAPPVTLPVLADGNWKGYYAVYSTPTYDALIHAEGHMEVKPKDAKGEYIGKPIVFGRWVVRYQIPGKPKPDLRPIVEFTTPAAPTEKMQKLTLRGKCKDDVTFEFTFECAGTKGVTFSGGITDPKKIAYPSYLEIVAAFPASHTIKPEVEQPDREKLLRGLTIESDSRPEGKRQKVKYAFADELRFVNPIEEARVIGPYAPRTIVLTPKDATVNGVNYSGNCPWQGYAFQYVTRETDARKQKAKFTLTVK